MSKTSLEILELVYLGLVSLLTLVGNCLVILAFIFGPRNLRTYTNYFVVNLAISDLMVGCVSLPFWMVYRADRPLVSNTNAYKYFISIDILCGIASILSLAAISLERMFAVKFPTKHFNLNSAPVFAGIIGTWLLGLTFAGCKFAVKPKTNAAPIYTATIFTLGFAVPLLVIIVSYAVIYCSAVKMMQAANHPGSLQRELRIAKMISVIIALFVFFWMPFFVVNMLYRFCDGFCTELREHKWLIHVTKMMHYSNSMMNFFVYAARSPDFRRSFKAILFKCDTSSLRQKVRSISESIVVRGRSSSERASFLNDVNSTQLNDSQSYARLMKGRAVFKNPRLSIHSNFTEVSTIDDAWSASNGSCNNSNSSTSTSFLLHPTNGNACIVNTAEIVPIEKQRSDSTV